MILQQFIRTASRIPILRVARILWLIVWRLFIVYAIVFALAGTYAIYRVARVVLKPINQVKTLVSSNPAESAYMADLRRQLRERGDVDTLTWSFVPLDSIAPSLIKAVLAAEDDGFYTHPGFDVAAILSAAEYNRLHNKVRHGGSTITQQLAKNLFLSGTRDYERKYMELLYALLLERYLGKDRILELYLNYAQWGPTMFGAEAAAREYYNKPASRLLLGESARMAAVLAMPQKLNPHNDKSSLLGKRLSVIAANLYGRKLIDDTAYESLSGVAPPRNQSEGFGNADSNETLISVDQNAPPAEQKTESVQVDDTLAGNRINTGRKERFIRREKDSSRVDR